MDYLALENIAATDAVLSGGLAREDVRSAVSIATTDIMNRCCCF